MDAVRSGQETGEQCLVDFERKAWEGASQPQQQEDDDASALLRTIKRGAPESSSSSSSSTASGWTTDEIDSYHRAKRQRVAEPEAEPYNVFAAAREYDEGIA